MRVVLLRVDSSFHIGAGHVSRCLNLAHSLQLSGCYPVFISRTLDGNLIPKISNHFRCYSFSIDNLDNPSLTQATDARAFLSIIPQYLLENAISVVVDHYDLDEIWESIIQDYFLNKNNSRVSFIAIDDFTHRKHAFPLLLNQSFSSSLFTDFSNQAVAGYRKAFMGSHYALLSPEYAAATSYVSNLARSNTNSILISFGGSDSRGVTLKVLQFLLSSKYLSCTFHVVLGPQNVYSEAIYRLSNHFPSLIIHQGLSSLLSLVSICNVAIAAPGL